MRLLTQIAAFFLLFGLLAPSQDISSIRAIEEALRPPFVIEGETPAKWRLADRMAFYKVPALSIAVIRRGKIEWAKAYGVLDKDSSRAANAESLFQAASISKPVTATATMTLVQQGKASLDEDVNDKLTSWKVPQNEFTASEKVTLRRLLSHSAGLTVHGFPGYAADAPVPSLVQILNGEKPANTGPIRVEAKPGSRWDYSGGGITIVQQLMIDLTSKRFPDIMRERVLTPFAMKRSTYQQPLPAALAANAAHAYGSDGSALPGRWHTYPEMAAAGLWTTPTDLAQFAIEIRRAAHGESDRVISADTAKAILTKQKDNWGLGFQLSGDTPSTLRFGHNGANAGYRCDFSMFLESGDGVAVMTNSDAGGKLIAEVMQSVAAAYGWPDYQPRKIKVIKLDPHTLSSFTGDYETQGMKITISVAGGKLWMKLPQGEQAQLLPETDTQFLIADGNLPVLKFVKEGDSFTGFQAFGQTAKRVATTSAH